MCTQDFPFYRITNFQLHNINTRKWSIAERNCLNVCMCFCLIFVFSIENEITIIYYFKIVDSFINCKSHLRVCSIFEMHSCLKFIQYVVALVLCCYFWFYIHSDAIFYVLVRLGNGFFSRLCLFFCFTFVPYHVLLPYTLLFNSLAWICWNDKRKRKRNRTTINRIHFKSIQQQRWQK